MNIIGSILKHTPGLKKKKPYTKRRPYMLSHFDRDLLIRVKIWARLNNIKIWEAVQDLILLGFKYLREKTGKTTRDFLKDEIRALQAKEEKLDGSD